VGTGTLKVLLQSFKSKIRSKKTVQKHNPFTHPSHCDCWPKWGETCTEDS